MAAATAWDRHDDRQYITVPIAYRDLSEVRAWCAENCRGDYLIDLGCQIVFERHDDAALAALWWRAEDD